VGVGAYYGNANSALSTCVSLVRPCFHWWHAFNCDTNTQSPQYGGSFVKFRVAEVMTITSKASKPLSLDLRMSRRLSWNGLMQALHLLLPLPSQWFWFSPICESGCSTTTSTLDHLIHCFPLVTQSADTSADGSYISHRYPSVHIVVQPCTAYATRLA
jgi:hypothetical protein